VRSSAAGPLAAFAAFGVFWGAWGVVLPDVKEQTGASVAGLGGALAVISVAALPAMLLAGLVADRIGGRLVAPTLLAFAAAVVLPGLADSVWQLTLALAFVGAASGALDVAINVAATAIEASGGGRLIQVAHALFSAGFLVAAVLVGLARSFGADPFPILGGCATLLVLVALLNRGALQAAGARPRRRLRVSGRLLLLGALCAVAFVVEGGIENWSALFLERELDASPAVGGLGPGLFAAAMVTGRLLGQRLEARVGDRHLLVAGGTTAAAGLGLAAAGPAVAVALAGFVLAGAGISVAAPTLFGAAGRSASDTDRGSAVASVTTVAYLGFLAGPPLIGVVSGAAGLRIGLLALAAVAALLALSASFARDALPLRRLQHPPRGVVR
jgi:MFS family permease